MRHVHLATALIVRDGCVLLVASRYPNHPQPLWNLPGGRQRLGELLSRTAARECLEETGYSVAIRELAYVGESYDRSDDAHFINAAFRADIVSGDARAPADDHVFDVAWVPVDEIAAKIVVAVVREPLLAYLRGELRSGYAGFEDAGITIRWPTDSS